MKLEESVDIIRNLIFTAFDKRLSMLGILSKSKTDYDNIKPDLVIERERLNDIIDNLEAETCGFVPAREKLLDELSFTLFNRIAGIKVMESCQTIPEVFTRRAATAGKSFGHKLWMEQYPQYITLPLDGLREYIQYAFHQLADLIQLYSKDYLYNLLPEVFDLDAIIEAFNTIAEVDWQSDDIMGWLYESYNRKKLRAFKESGAKIEYNWVSLSSQVYTPRWVVEFILNNSLGKLWLEMHPQSSLKQRHDIANIPDKPTQKQKPVEQIRVLDTTVGSGNFLLYAFDLFYEIYLEQGTPESEIPKKIIENNLYGIDLDDRSIQIAQLGLYIKALKKNKNTHIKKMNVVSSDFYLPEYKEVQNYFEELNIHKDSMLVLKSIWGDLRLAYKFGSLIRIEKTLSVVLESYMKEPQTEMFEKNEKVIWDDWKNHVIPNIKNAVKKYSKNINGKVSFLKTKTLDGLTFVEILQNKFDVVVANPPYTDSGDYGSELKAFMIANYKKPLTFNNNLYGACLKRATELIHPNGKVGFVNPPTFMYIKTFEDMRRYMINNYHINVFVEWGYLGMFTPTARVDSAIYILENKNTIGDTTFIKLNDLYETKRKSTLFKAFKCHLNNEKHPLLYHLEQSKLKSIKSYPFIYWIADEFREKFSEQPLGEIASVKVGINSGGNERFLRFWWEVDQNDVSKEYATDRKKWVPYAKGGPFDKWYGNLWLVLFWNNNGDKLKASGKAVLRNKKYYFQKGITYSGSGSKGISFRILPKNHIFDVGGSCIFPREEFKDNYYTVAFLNSKLSFYIMDCLNPTVNNQVGDLQRIPFTCPNKELENHVSLLAEQNVNIKKHLCEFSIVETNYNQHPLLWARTQKPASDLRQLIRTYLDYENEQLVQVFLHEAVIDAIIFEVYQLSGNDKKKVLEKEGTPIGSLPLIKRYHTFHGSLPDFVSEFIQNLEIKEFSTQELQSLEKELEELYKANYSIEEISLKKRIHPHSVILLLRESPILPQKRMNDLAKDFLFDVVWEVLREDDDGIIPLVESAGETTLQKRLYDKLIEKGFFAFKNML